MKSAVFKMTEELRGRDVRAFVVFAWDEDEVFAQLQTVSHNDVL